MQMAEGVCSAETSAPLQKRLRASADLSFDEGPHRLARALEALGRPLGEQVDATVDVVS